MNTLEEDAEYVAHAAEGIVADEVFEVLVHVNASPGCTIDDVVEATDINEDTVARMLEHVTTLAVVRQARCDGSVEIYLWPSAQLAALAKQAFASSTKEGQSASEP